MSGKTGLYQFSKEANVRLNQKVNDLLKEIFDIVENERKRLNNNDPNFVIVNNQTLALSIIHVIANKVNKANVEYAGAVVSEMDKREKLSVGG